MRYYEIQIKTSVIAIDAVTNLLYAYGATGVMINNPDDEDFINQAEVRWDYYDPQNLKLDFEGALLVGYFEDIEPEITVSDLASSLEALSEMGIDVGLSELSYSEIFPSQWENEWKKYFKPFRVGERIVVKPSWESFDLRAGDLLIEIDPGNSFGSGTHETTSLCIEMLDKYMSPGDTIIDVGTGSGILSIAAGKLGAKEVIAVDIDALAVNTARENLLLNGLSEISQVRQGDLIDVVGERADVVVANIIADVIVKLAEDIDKVMKTDALFIGSGIINTKLDWVLSSLEAMHFEFVEVITKGEWSALVAKKRVKEA